MLKVVRKGEARSAARPDPPWAGRRGRAIREHADMRDRVGSRQFKELESKAVPQGRLLCFIYLTNLRSVTVCFVVAA